MPATHEPGDLDALVCWLLSHRARLTALDPPIPLLMRWPDTPRGATPAVAARFDARLPRPILGWLVGEVIRRITGRTPGTYRLLRHSGRGDSLGCAHPATGLPC